MSDIENEGTDRGQAVLAIFQRGAEFTRELVEENIRLRRELSEMQLRDCQAAQSDAEWGKLREQLSTKIEELEGENQTILERLRNIEGENIEFADRHLAIEEENNNLANLYVASYQLHSTLALEEVVKAILEIVINLIGAEVFAVYVRDGDSDVLGAVAAEGAPVSSFPRWTIGVGFVGESVANGEVAVCDPASRTAGAAAGVEPIVSIPLRVEGQPVGAIVIDRLLDHKNGFSKLDHELFTLLAGHAATAIFASRLYSQSERQLSTIKGFIELLTE